jgi:putative addiction module component (TIGR02574 family)
LPLDRTGTTLRSHSLAELSEEESDQLWAQEAERRFAEYKAGNIEAVPADDVFARLRSRRK